MDWQAIGVSVRLALATTAILLVVAVPLASWLTYSRRRWTVVVEALVALPLVLPPTVLGYYVLVAMGNRSPMGRWWQEVTGSSLAFSFTGLLVASVLYSLPFAVQPLLAAFAGVDRRLLEASEVLGRSPWGTTWRVLLPLCRPGLATAAVLTFAHTIGEFGVVLMSGGAIPGSTRVASIAIFAEVEAMNYAAAHRHALILLAATLPVMLALQRYRRRPVEVL